MQGKHPVVMVNGVAMTDPRNIFISALDGRCDTAKPALRAALEAKRQDLEQLDLQTLQTVLASVKHQQDLLKSSYGKTAGIEWMNFMARWTTGTGPTEDAAVQSQLASFPDFQGFLVVDIDLPQPGLPKRQVHGRIEAEPGVRNNLLDADGGNRILQNVPIHRVYNVKVGAYHHINLQMGPSGQLKLDDKDKLRWYATSHMAPGADDTAALLELTSMVYEINALTTLDQLLK
jgi:hypothetical protein